MDRLPGTVLCRLTAKEPRDQRDLHIQLVLTWIRTRRNTNNRREKQNRTYKTRPTQKKCSEKNKKKDASARKGSLRDVLPKQDVQGSAVYFQASTQFVLSVGYVSKANETILISALRCSVAQSAYFKWLAYSLEDPL